MRGGLCQGKATRLRPRQRLTDLHTVQKAVRSCRMTSSRKRKPKPVRVGSGMTTGEAAVAALLAHGLDAIYALPGVHNDDFFDALHGVSDRLRVVHTRHEQGAAYMALGAALAT